MSEQQINTSKSTSAGADLPANVRKEINDSLKKALAQFKDQKTVKVSINKNYAKFIGDLIPFNINGVRIVLPVDGSKQEVPEGFKELIEDYLANVKM